MKVLQLTHYDIFGGAGRAAYRLHHALRNENIDSTMMVNMGSSGDWTVQGPRGKLQRLLTHLRPWARKLPCALMHTKNPIIHSPNFLPSNWSRRLNSTDLDVVHLHWVADEMISIADLGQLRKPIVWTLHDMWAFCGAEHYTDELRWQEGYMASNRPSHETGFDLNRWTWQRKRKHWQHHMHIVAPSRWLGDCARESLLMRDWPISVVPNAIDTESWHPIDKHLARELLGLPLEVPLLLFGAMGAITTPRKGIDLLQGALNFLNGQIPNLELVLFGQMAPKDPPDLGFPAHYTGRLHDDLTLKTLYSASDLLVIPSRQDNLPNTGIEALACGTPVVAFDTGGLSDIVIHRKNGYLATAFDIDDLANGICWVFENLDRSGLGENAREHAVSQFSYPVVAKCYAEIYGLAVNSS
jgi:glycosyltransferase involved in cell wall biosynthesis